jgi:hypothetical protein
VKRRAFTRALRVQVALSDARVREYLDQNHENDRQKLEQ